MTVTDSVTELYPYQVKIHVDKHKYDAMGWNRPWIRWCKENVGNDEWINTLHYEPEFAMIYYFKHETHATWFKLRFS